MVTMKKKVTVKVIGIAVRTGREPGYNPFAKTKASDLKDKTKFVPIKEAVAVLGCSHPLYISQLLKAGKIEGIKLQLPGKAKWFVSVASIEYYNANKNTRSGMRRYMLRAAADDKDAIEKALKDAGITFTLEFNYKASKGSNGKKAKAPAAEVEIIGLDFE